MMDVFWPLPQHCIGAAELGHVLVWLSGNLPRPVKLPPRTQVASYDGWHHFNEDALQWNGSC